MNTNYSHIVRNWPKSDGQDNAFWISSEFIKKYKTVYNLWRSYNEYEFQALAIGAFIFDFLSARCLFQIIEIIRLISLSKLICWQFGPKVYISVYLKTEFFFFIIYNSKEVVFFIYNIKSLISKALLVMYTLSLGLAWPLF